MFGFIAWIGLGLLLGFAARLLWLRTDPDGPVVTVLLGIAGAVLAPLLTIALGRADYGDASMLFAAFFGAAAALGLKTWAARVEQRSRTHG